MKLTMGIERAQARLGLIGRLMRLGNVVSPVLCLVMLMRMAFGHPALGWAYATILNGVALIAIASVHRREEETVARLLDERWRREQIEALSADGRRALAGQFWQVFETFVRDYRDQLIARYWLHSTDEVVVLCTWRQGTPSEYSVHLSYEEVLKGGFHVTRAGYQLTWGARNPLGKMQDDLMMAPFNRMGLSVDDLRTLTVEAIYERVFQVIPDRAVSLVRGVEETPGPRALSTAQPRETGEEIVGDDRVST